MNETLLVTDTHPMINFFCAKGRGLSTRVNQAFVNATTNLPTAIFVPVPVLWEMSMLVQQGDITLSKPFEEWVDELFAYPMINACPFDQETIKIVHTLHFHNDPFDQSIVASAIQLNLPLITNDSKIHAANPCKLFWD